LADEVIIATLPGSDSEASLPPIDLPKIEPNELLAIIVKNFWGFEQQEPID